MKTEDGASLFPAILGRIAAILSRFTIKSTLIGGFLVLIIASVIVVLISKWGEEYALRMMTRLIQVDNEISDLCLKSTTAMIDARRNEKDFLLNYREFGFAEARSRYITRVITDLADIKGYMDNIRRMTRDPEMIRQAGEVDRAVSQYQAGLLAFVDKFGARGQLDSGIEGALRTEARALEEMLGRNRNDLLQADLLSVRIAEKDFMERALDEDAARVQEGLDRFGAHVSESALPGGQKKRLRDHAAAYGNLFRKYAAATEELRTIKKDYLKAVQTVDPILERLYLLSIGRLKANRNTVEKTVRLVDMVVVVAGVAMLLLSVGVALAISDIVSTAVIRSKAFAEKIASGDLTGRLSPQGKNEFFALSSALNAMAESLQHAAAAQKKWMDELTESEQRFRAIFDNASDGILLADPSNMRLIGGNRMICIMLGYSLDEIRGLGVSDIHTEEGLPYAMEQFGRQARGEITQAADLPIRRKDGTFFYADVNAFPITLEGKTYMIGFFRDATDRKEIERQLREHGAYLEELVARRTAEAMKSSHLASIGELAAGVAHEINNPINSVINFAQILTDKLDASPGEKDIAARIMKEGDRIAGIVSSLLSFGREKRYEKTSIQIGETLAAILPLTNMQLHKDAIHLTMEGMDRLPAVTASPQQLQQVFLNLISNARYALNVKYPHPHEDKRLVITCSGIMVNDIPHVRIVFLDYGTGISPGVLARTATPFFTTKPEGQGTGLGLSISRGIIEEHGGTLALESEEGRYTKVIIDLPSERSDGGKG